MSSTSHKDLNKLITKLVAQGWRYRKSKHLILYPPDKIFPQVVMPMSGGGGRGYKNAIALLRNYGADI